MRFCVVVPLWDIIDYLQESSMAQRKSLKDPISVYMLASCLLLGMLIVVEREYQGCVLGVFS